MSGLGIFDLDMSIRIINASLAPALLISAVGLLLAGLQAKYSTLISVIRELTKEARQLKESHVSMASIPAPTLSRLAVVIKQIANLISRSRLIRNAILSMYLGTLLLLGTGILIGCVLSLYPSWGWIAALSFLIGVIMIVVGIFYAFREALLCYRIIELEFSEASEALDP